MYWLGRDLQPSHPTTVLSFAFRTLTLACSCLRLKPTKPSCCSAACVSVYEESKQHCDEKCQKRARAGEVVIVTIVLVVALISGLACLGSLGTPTKFQQPARGRGTAS